MTYCFIDSIVVFCRVYNDFLNCYHDEVEDTCGDDAAEWTWEFDVRILQPQLDVNGCDLQRSSGDVGQGIYNAFTAAVIRNTLMYDMYP